MKKTTTLAAILALLALVFLTTLASADELKLLCISKGEKVEFSKCNSLMDDYTCAFTHCQLCVNYRSDGIYCNANPNACNSQSGLSCTTLSGNNSLDQEPPALSLTSPVKNTIYQDRAVLIKVNASEIVEFHIKDELNPASGWKLLCANCKSYQNTRSFTEGKNNITVRATDKADNMNYSHVVFYVDSVSPKITSVSPTAGFASGNFSVNFQEANPKNVTLRYGNTQNGFKSKSIPVQQCFANLDKYSCSTFVDLSMYSGQQIEFWFEVSDIADALATSKHLLLDVDSTPPLLSSFSYQVQGKYVLFSLDIVEPYFDAVSFVDNLESRPKKKSLCTSLTGTLCEKKVSFKDGDHNLTIFITDEAGNTITRNIKFFTDSKAPKIRKVEPAKGFASGFFELMFEEENPQKVLLIYGNSQKGYTTKSLSLSSDCMMDGKNRICDTTVDLASFHAQQLKYYFEVTDKVNTTSRSKNITLDVDTVYPVIGTVNVVKSGDTALLNVSITESNLDDVLYLNHQDTRPSQKALCTRLKGSYCSGKVRLNPGTNSIDIQATDLAGNAVAKNIIITL